MTLGTWKTVAIAAAVVLAGFVLRDRISAIVPAL